MFPPRLMRCRMKRVMSPGERVECRDNLCSFDHRSQLSRIFSDICLDLVCDKLGNGAEMRQNLASLSEAFLSGRFSLLPSEKGPPAEVPDKFPTFLYRPGEKSVGTKWQL